MLVVHGVIIIIIIGLSMLLWPYNLACARCHSSVVSVVSLIAIIGNIIGIVLTLKNRASGCDSAKSFVGSWRNNTISSIQYPLTSPVTTTHERRELGIDNKIKNKYPYYLRREHANHNLTENKIKLNIKNGIELNDHIKQAITINEIKIMKII